MTSIASARSKASLLFLALVSVALVRLSNGFTVVIPQAKTRSLVLLLAEEPDGGLVLGSKEIEKQLASLRSKLPTSEADYLAAARQRAAEQRASNNNSGSDEDWNKIAQAKKQQEQQQEQQSQGDGWEASLNDGSSDSKSLLFFEEQHQGKDSGDNDNDAGAEEEPKLLIL